MAAGANEADVVDNPGKAEVHEAEEAEANEADDAIVTNKAVDTVVTAGCKAFSLANEKGTGTNDWVIKSLDD